MKHLILTANNTITLDGRKNITKGKEYEILSIIPTEHCGSKFCAVILDDRNNITGYDITHFDILVKPLYETEELSNISNPPAENIPGEFRTTEAYVTR